MSKKIRVGLISYLQMDKDFLKLYQKNEEELKGMNGWDYTYNNWINELVDFFLGGDFNPYLSKPYIDMSYLRVDKKLVNLDLLWDIAKLWVE